jgi:hypothetical protein
VIEQTNPFQMSQSESFLKIYHPFNIKNVPNNFNADLHLSEESTPRLSIPYFRPGNSFLKGLWTAVAMKENGFHAQEQISHALRVMSWFLLQVRQTTRTCAMFVNRKIFEVLECRVR